MNIRTQCVGRAQILAVTASLAARAGTITPVPEKVAPIIADRQDFQVPDRVHLGGWIGTRLAANEGNRLVEEGAANLQLRDGTSVTVTTETEYPSGGRIRITLSHESKKSFALKLRIPAWCQSPGLRVNGQTVNAELAPDGYVALRQEWKKGDRVQLTFKLEPRVIIGDHKNEDRSFFLPNLTSIDSPS